MATFNYLVLQYHRLGLNLDVKWIPREENKVADSLARQATAEYKKQNKNK